MQTYEMTPETSWRAGGERNTLSKTRAICQACYIELQYDSAASELTEHVWFSNMVGSPLDLCFHPRPATG